MKNRISFTSVLQSKTKSPKPSLINQFNQNSNYNLNSNQYITSQYSQSEKSLAEMMDQYQQYPDQEYILNFDANNNTNLSYQNSKSQQNSVFDSKGSKGQVYGNFDDWIASQARQQNKQNIADIQPRLRNAIKNKGILNFFSSKDSHQQSQQSKPKSTKKIITNKNKIGLGKLCSMFNQNQIQDNEPIWKCQPNESSSQINSLQENSSRQSFNHNQSRQSFNNSGSQCQSNTSHSQTKDFIKQKPKGIVFSKEKQNQIIINNNKKFVSEQEINQIKLQKIKSSQEERFSNKNNKNNININNYQQINVSNSLKTQNNITNKCKPLRQVNFETDKKSYGEYSSEQEYLHLSKERQMIKQQTMKSIQKMAMQIIQKQKSKKSCHQQDDEMLLTERKSQQKYFLQKEPKQIHVFQSKKSIKAIDDLNECLDTQQRIKAVQNQLSQIIKLKKSQKNKGNQQKFTFENVRQNRPSFTAMISPKSIPSQHQYQEYLYKQQQHVPRFASLKLQNSKEQQIRYILTETEKNNSKQETTSQNSTGKVGYSFSNQLCESKEIGITKKQQQVKLSIVNSQNLNQMKDNENMEESMNTNEKNFKKYVQGSNSKIPKIQSIDFTNYNKMNSLKNLDIKNSYQNIDYKLQESVKFNENYEQQQQKMLGSTQKFILENSIPGQIKGSKNIDDDTVVQDDIEDQDNTCYQIIKQSIKQSSNLNSLKQSPKIQKHQFIQASLKQIIKVQSHKKQNNIQQNQQKDDKLIQISNDNIQISTDLKVSFNNQYKELEEKQNQISYVKQTQKLIQLQNMNLNLNDLKSQATTITKNQIKQQKKQIYQIQNIIINLSEKEPELLEIKVQKQAQFKNQKQTVHQKQEENFTKSKISIKVIESNKKSTIASIIQQQKQLQFHQILVQSIKKQQNQDKEFQLDISMNLGQSSRNLKGISNKYPVPVRQVSINPINFINKPVQVTDNLNSLKKQNNLKNSLLRKSGRFSNGDDQIALELQFDFQ